MTIIYSIPAPYSNKVLIVVYGDDEMASYEYRIVSDGTVLHDTTDACYGCAEIALRDALIHVTTTTDDIPEDRVKMRKDYADLADHFAKDDPELGADLHRILREGAARSGGDEIDPQTHAAVLLAAFEGGRRSWRRKGLAGTTGDA